MPYKRGAPIGNKNRLKHGHYAMATLSLRRACRRALYEAQARLADARLLRAQVRTLEKLMRSEEQSKQREEED